MITKTKKWGSKRISTMTYSEYACYIIIISVKKRHNHYILNIALVISSKSLELGENAFVRWVLTILAI